MKTVVGVFADRATAEAVERDLQSSGFPCEHVRIHSSSATKGAGATGMSPLDRPGSMEASGAYGDDAGSREFLRLGTMSDDYRARYMRAIGRGGVLVMATVDDKYADQAVTVMERHEPLDIDEREGNIQAGSTATGLSPATGDSRVQTGRDRSPFGPKVFVW
ncbi:MAG TPA: hypothetical protein VN428_08880 [Bryobacteraceae bacterium]|nr:hypothetical protein [Bryobacteraceae bacterium]